ncbi:hypothetical protein CR161_10345 [Prosthecochloris sp. ZM]|uniref:hypothetical protein n=1 Tax=Prosthecochloris sp. ZM TaxID=2283143 RepID=UPI000DF7877A|nr:hypothetical protein [Prosthecochloris sp. ZM]RDD31063.1 hypothetical protein CR161_10345 [Prosthecochloris sp. ZM]
MANEGTTNAADAISGAINSLGNLAVSQIKVIDNSIQSLMPTINNVSKSLGSTLETGVKTMNDSLVSLSAPANSLLETCGEVAATGIKAVSSIAWKGAEIVGSVGNNALSIVQSGISTVGNVTSSVLPGKKI